MITIIICLYIKIRILHNCLRSLGFVPREKLPHFFVGSTDEIINIFRAPAARSVRKNKSGDFTLHAIWIWKLIYEIYGYTLWLFNISMENGPFIDDIHDHLLY